MHFLSLHINFQCIHNTDRAEVITIESYLKISSTVSQDSSANYCNPIFEGLVPGPASMAAKQCVIRML